MNKSSSISSSPSYESEWSDRIEIGLDSFELCSWYYTSSKEGEIVQTEMFSLDDSCTQWFRLCIKLKRIPAW